MADTSTITDTSGSSGYGSSSAGYYAFFAVYATVVTAVIVLFLSLSTNRYEMRGRMPIIVVCGLIGGILVLLPFTVFYAVTVSAATEVRLCIAGELVQAAGFYMFCVSYLVRSIYLRFLFDSRQASNKRSMNKRTKQWQLIIGFFVGLFFALALIALLQIIRAKVLNETCTVGLNNKLSETGFSLSTIASLIELIIVFILITTAGLIVWGVPDQFNIGLEIRVASLAYIVIVIISFVLIVKFRQSGYSSIPLMIYFPCCLIAAGLGPYLLWQKQRVAMAKCGNALEMHSMIVSLEQFKLQLMDVDFLDDFRQFAAEEFSVENVLLWEELVRYRNAVLKNQIADAAEIAKMISDQFIGPYATLQVNLDGHTSARVVERIQSGDNHHPNLFDEIERLTLDLMYYDTFHRYYAVKNESSGSVARMSLSARNSSDVQRDV